MKVHFPGLVYDPERSLIVGRCDFVLKYQNQPIISDSYEIFINLNTITDSNSLPYVWEIRGRIHRMAKILGINNLDLHVFSDGRLCLIRPDKIKNYYPAGFELVRFMENLQRYFYWVTFRYRYGFEPWPGEKHGWID